MALKAKDLRQLDVEELKNKAEEIRKELIFEKGPKRKSLRKSLARILTIISEKERAR